MLNEKEYIRSLRSETKEKMDYEEATLTRVTDPAILKQFEREHDTVVGFIQNQPYYDFRMDVYLNRDGTPFRYCNVDYRRQGAAILVVLKRGGDRFYLLNRQYRPFLKEIVSEVPRGFANPEDHSSLQTAIRELAEETCIHIEENAEIKLERLGTVHPDSGLSNNKVSLFIVELPLEECANLGVQDDEAIVGHCILSEKEFKNGIASDKITDGFTLASFAKYLSRRT